MSGILDKKNRVIDALVTYEGRRQLSTGNFTVKYVSFNDRAIVYQLDENEGHVDPNTKIYLEAYNSPNDQITFEADDSGRLVPFRQHTSFGVSTEKDNINQTSQTSWFSLNMGKVLTQVQNLSIKPSDYSGSISTGINQGTAFASQIEGILTSSIDNFKSLGIIGTVDKLFQDSDFSLGPNDVTYTLKATSENISMMFPSRAERIDPLFSDEKLRNVINFKYLPPIRKAPFSIDKSDQAAIMEADLLLGNYPPWGPLSPLSFSDISREVEKYESKTIYFDPTSRDNQIIGQFFEIRNDSVEKLDVIDYGKVTNNTFNPLAESHHVFFVGKVITDATGTNSFIHLFTMIFESGEE